MQPTVTHAGEGKTHHWQNDTITVRLTGDDTAGLYTLVEDHMKETFSLPRHVHHQHAETFHVLEGTLEFTFDDQVVVATPGSTVHVPAGTPHAVRTLHGAVRSLMVYAPAGFERYLDRLAGMTAEQFADQGLMRALEEEFDNHTL